MKKRPAQPDAAIPDAPDAYLPEGWVETRMGDIATVIGGGTPTANDPENFTEHGYPWITPADLSGFSGTYVTRGRRDLAEKGLASCSARLIPMGAVLMSSRAPIGYVAIAAKELCTNQGFKSFILASGIEPKYVFYWLKFKRDDIEAMGSGSTFVEISGSRCKEIPISLPPLAEQKQIVAKVEELLARVNAAREQLAKVPAILKRLRQSVLAAACSGGLTEEWREANFPMQEEINKESGDDLPLGWHRKPLRDLCDRFQYGSSQKSQKEGEVPVLRMGNIQNGEIDWNNLAFTSDATEIGRYLLKPKTVLFNRTNSPELVGKTGIYRGERPAVFAGYLIAIQQGDELDPDYLNYCLNTDEFRDFRQMVKTGRFRVCGGIFH